MSHFEGIRLLERGQRERSAPSTGSDVRIRRSPRYKPCAPLRSTSREPLNLPLGWVTPRSGHRKHLPDAPAACKHTVARTRPRSADEIASRMQAHCNAVLAPFTPHYLNRAFQTTSRPPPDAPASARPVQLRSSRQPRRQKSSQDSGSYNSEALPPPPALVPPATPFPKTNCMLLLRVIVTTTGAHIPSLWRIHPSGRFQG